MTTRLRRDIEVLHGLLALEFVADDGPGEAILLLESNLTSPAIYEICLLTDLLPHLLDTIAKPPLILQPASGPTLTRGAHPRAAGSCPARDRAGSRQAEPMWEGVGTAR